ncbi:MAG: FmdB family transcriptional regulator [Chloroflexi bacterium]|nr:FmdB family transcriptional regulator [Chloroflexota bacterium]
MPTYEYRCDDNGHEFETIQGFNDQRQAECPTCGSASQRRISMPAIHFKGSGWYRKDNASSGSRSSGASSSSESSDDSKSENKSKTDSKSSSDSSSSSSDSSSDSSGSKTHSHGGSTHSH